MMSELFAFLVKHIQRLVTSKQIVTTNGSEVVCSPPQDTSLLAPCNHEEADTRMILHLADAVSKDFQKILLRTVDTDVVVLSVAAAATLDIQALWVAFGTGKNFRYMPIHENVASIGPSKSQALPNVSCIYWMRHSFVICYKGKEDSMGYLESVRRSNCNIPCTFYRTRLSK